MLCFFLAGLSKEVDRIALVSLQKFVGASNAGAVVVSAG